MSNADDRREVTNKWRKLPRDLRRVLAISLTAGIVAACGLRHTISNCLVQGRKTLGSHSIGSDFDVEMAPSVDLMQFDKGQTVNVQFEMGGFLPLQVATPRPL
jgi:hypothetical protein